MICRNSPWLPLLVLLLGAGCAEEATKTDEAERKQRLRSLPYVSYSDQPARSAGGVVKHDANRSYPGYNLYVVRGLCRAELLDSAGTVLGSWHDDTFDFWQDFELLPGGSFLVLGRKKTPDDGRPADPFGNRALLKLSARGEKLLEVPIDAHHEIHFTPGRPLVTLLFDWRQIREVHDEAPVLDNRLATISDLGEVVDSVSLYDLLRDAADFRLQDVKEVDGPGGAYVDLLHTNTVEWIEHSGTDPIYAPGNLIVTIRHQDAVVIVDWEVKEVIWSWGQGELSGPHDATVLDNGNILIFDNGLGRDWSRVVELEPLTGRIVWEYRAPDPEDFYTATRGTSQRLANGNTLITESNRGRVIEVTPSGEIVWEFHTPHRDARGHPANIIRMRRYEQADVAEILVSRSTRAPEE